MDAPPNGPEEGLIPRSPALLVAGVELLGAGDGTVELDVAGTSMLPTLSPGDRVRIRLDRRTPKVGEIVVFSQGDSIVVHRYLGPAAARDGTPCLRSRGDGRSELDPPLFRERMIGTAVAVRRRGAWRSLDGGGARLYGAAVAAHDLVWSGVAHLAGRVSVGARSVAAALDRALLKGADRAFFAILHRAAPESANRGPRKAR